MNYFDVFSRSKNIAVIGLSKNNTKDSYRISQYMEIKKKYDNLNTIWMQIGIQNNNANMLLSKTGLNIVMNKCIMIEHKKYLDSMN